MFIALEYAAKFGSARDGVHTPLRQDGHYSDRADAMQIAEAWAADPLTPGSIVVVAEVCDWVRKA